MFKKIIIITTSIIILIASLALSASAATYVISKPISVDLKIVNEAGVYSTDTGLVPVLYTNVPSRYPTPTPNILIYPEGYDYYVGKTIYINNSTYAEWGADLSIDYEFTYESGFNSLEFSVGVFCESSGSENEVYDPWDYVSLSFDDSISGAGGVSDQYILTYTVSEPKQLTSANTTYYRNINIKVHFPELYLYDLDNLKVNAFSYLPAYPYGGGPSVGYLFGLDEMKVQVTTTDEFLGNVVSGISQTNEKLTIIGDVLSTELTDEQQQKLDEAEVRRETVATYEEEIEEKINATYEEFVENADPIIEADIDTAVGDRADKFTEGKVSDLISGIWDNYFVRSMIALVLMIAPVGFALYGLRRNA